MRETQRQDADEVLRLNECLVTNDLGLCYQVPWAVLLRESHLSGTCEVLQGSMGLWVLFCCLLIQASDGWDGALGRSGTQRGVAIWDVVVELTAQEGFYFLLLSKNPRLPVDAATVCRNNCTAEG